MGWKSRTEQWAHLRIVYFVQATVGGPVKVGTSSDMANRLQSFQLGSPFDLRVLAVMKGDSWDEAMIHRALGDACVGGEWFDPRDPKLLSWLEKLGAKPFDVAPWDPSKGWNCRSLSFGASMLGVWIEDDPRRIGNLVRELRVSSRGISNWCNGSLPSQDLRLAFQRIADIPELYWAKFEGDTWTLPGDVRIDPTLCSRCGGA